LATFKNGTFARMDLNLHGKKALVCGSSQGIGLASARELAGLGAEVVLFARNEDSLKKAVATLPADQDRKHGYLVADFSDTDAVKQSVSDYLKAGNTLHILVNNTGGPPGGPITDADGAQFLTAFQNHLINNQNLAQLLLPGMKAAGFGRIINIISTSVKIPLNGLGVSNTVRGAVGNWSKTWANEVGHFNITVNNVLPGATETERLTSIIANKARKTGASEKEVAASMANAVPMKRFAKPEEVANAVAFLASPAAAYINGINVPVDGGRTGSL
jgi:3-oxoacyl-[acyl-carrier protein] reductase